MAQNYNGLMCPTLYQLLPKRELKLHRGHILLGSTKQDHHIVKAFCKAIHRIPTPADGAAIFEDLFERVAFHLTKRLTHGRMHFWYDVTEGWEQKAGVILTPDDVRRLVLKITLAERRWEGEKCSAARNFLTYVRVANDSFRQHEPDSDEAVELLAEIEAMKRARNVFAQMPTEKIPWTESGQLILSTVVHNPPEDKQLKPTSSKPVESESDKPPLTETQNRNLRRKNYLPNEDKIAERHKLLAARSAEKKKAKKAEELQQKRLEKKERYQMENLERSLIAAYENGSDDDTQHPKSSDNEPSLSEDDEPSLFEDDSDSDSSKQHSSGPAQRTKRPIEAAEENEPPTKKVKFDIVVGRTKPTGA